MSTLAAELHDRDQQVQERFELEDIPGSLATFWRQATPGTTYWRCFLPAKYLPARLLGFRGGGVEVKYDEAQEYLHFLRTNDDTFIWQFLGDDLRSRIALQAHKQGVRTLMELDDNYIRVPPTHSKNWAKTHEIAVQRMKQGIGTGYSHEQHRLILPLMDGIIVSTDHLAEEYSRFNDNIYVCPNSVDPTDWDVKRVESDVLRIGYYGSASHMHDWPIIKKLVKKLQREKGVEFYCIGYAPPGWSGLKLPWEHDLFEARQNLGKIDVGLAPLRRGNWENGKSDVKALEYAMAGVMPILQGGVEPYSPWAPVWDWMPETPAEWEELVMHVVRNPDIVKREAAKAKAYVLRERTIEGSIDLWKEAIRG